MRRAVVCRSGMKPSHFVNSAPQSLQRMFLMLPGVIRIQRWGRILQELADLQYGHFMVDCYFRNILIGGDFRNRVWRRDPRVFLRGES